MADFDPPFAHDGERRLPTAAEIENGFPCGPADQFLFNALFYRIESELGDLITFAGITGTDDRNTLVREAVLALIEAATGGGDPSTYLTMPQARARLPIFPTVLTSDGRITVVTAAGNNVRIPGGVSFNHRGVYTVTTVQTDFPTAASRIYHMRWDPINGVRLLDLANVVYNPTALAETDPTFDTNYDDMLIARVITNSSNVATITNLANLDRLYFISRQNGTAIQSDNVQNGYHFTTTATYNWSRVPKNNALQGSISCFSVTTAAGLEATAAYITRPSTPNRYTTGADVFNDYEQGSVISAPTGYIEFNLAA